MAKALDLYAKVEDLLGLKEASPKLYAHYLLALNGVEFDSILDVGCGGGDFLYQINRAFLPNRSLGIDLSPEMVKRAKEVGVDAKVIELCSVDDSFDVITAVFDMLNYLNRDGLKSFLLCISNHLNSGGHFLCDINTLYGFEEVAVGAFIVDDDSRFLTIESDFEDNIYSSEFTLFEKRENGIYHKSQETIKQYYYAPKEIEEILSDVGLELIEDSGVTLYLEEEDKRFLLFKKRDR